MSGHESSRPRGRGRWITTRFVISKEGTVENACIASETIEDGQAVDCILRTFEVIEFPPARGLVTVYPILYTPAIHSAAVADRECQSVPADGERLICFPSCDAVNDLGAQAPLYEHSTRTAPDGDDSRETAPAIGAIRSRLRACYDAGRTRDKNTKGRVLTKIWLDGDGDILGIEAIGLGHVDQELVECAVTAERSAPFPASKNGARIIRVPITFASATSRTAVPE